MTIEKQSPALEKYLTPIAVLLGAIIIALAFAFGSGGERPATPGGGKAAPVDIEKVSTEGSPYVGEENAPVTIAVWFDFQCRFCKQFEATTLKEMREEYGDDVRIVYKDFQFLGPASVEAAVYSRAVWEAAPGAWHEWFSKVMAGEGETTLSKAGLDQIASDLGIDTGRVASLIESKRAQYEAAMAADRTEGQSFGITGTPGSIVGTTLIGGAQPYANVKTLIVAELDK
jgi:protein-disulfide isomerase